MKNKLLKISILAAIACTPVTSVLCQSHATLMISNPAEVSREDELISLSRADIGKQLHVLSKGISVTQNGNRLPIQLIDENGDGKWEHLDFLYTFKPKQKVSFEIVADPAVDPITTAPKAHVRLRKKNADDTFGPSVTSETMPLRNPATDFSKHHLPDYLTEGPAWENDKVAFRLYFDVRNNKDIYGKTTAKMMMDTVGANYKVSYHNLSAWGMDVLHVVKSLGAGALALLVPREGEADTLVRLGGRDVSKTVYQQIADGPLVAQFKVTYDWQINNKPVQVIEAISIWGGQYFYDSKVSVTGAPEGSKLVTGIADFYENTFGMINKDNAVIAFSHGRQAENKDNLGLAVLVSKKNFVKADSVNRNNTDVNETYYVTQRIEGNSPLYYRFYAGWERTDKQFETYDGFKAFLQKEAIRFSKPIEVRWKKS